MIIKSFAFENFRNIENISIAPCPGVNIIYGENAQGKTNIIEALWLFTGYKSFRGSKDSDLIRFGEQFAQIQVQYLKNTRDIKSRIIISDKRHAYRNSVELDSPSELLGDYKAIVFSPSHLSLVKDGPGERRKFIDIAVCQLNPGYADCLKKYRFSLAQRNCVLKDVKYHSELYDTLEIWEQQLSLYGAKIIAKRLSYIKMLAEAAQNVYSGICDGSESFFLKYITAGINTDKDADENEIRSLLADKFRKTRGDDILLGITYTGPHRDDLSVEVNGKKVRSFGSQGQQRSAALAMKLGEAEIINSFTGEKPVVLLDDVMSELDLKRQDYVLNKISEYQVFITCCEPSQPLRLCSGNTYKIKNGGIAD